MHEKLNEKSNRFVPLSLNIIYFTLYSQIVMRFYSETEMAYFFLNIPFHYSLLFYRCFDSTKIMKKYHFVEI